MSESFNNTPSASKAPSHSAYHVRNRKAGDAIWTRIGSAWQHAEARASISRSKPFLSMAASACAFHPSVPSNPTGRVSQPARYQFKRSVSCPILPQLIRSIFQ